MAQRQKFVDVLREDFRTTTLDELRNGRRVNVPVLDGQWWYADLLPTPAMAEALVADIVSWEAGPRPKKEALAVMAAFGPTLVPYLDRALAAKERAPHHAVLVAARKLFGDTSGDAPVKRKKRT